VKWSFIVACLIAVVAAGCGRDERSRPAGGRARVRIAAASDLNAALGDLITTFTASRNIDVSVSYGSSGTFYAQLLNRAPFDLFLSADIAYPHQLTARGLTVPGSEFTYANGRIVLWTPASSPLDITHAGLEALTSSRVAHIAIANPAHAPYGRAAVAALTHAGIYDQVRSKLVLGENVAQAMQFVSTGAADAGLVALSLAMAPASRDTGRWFDIPAADYPAIEQGGVILQWASDVDAARAFGAYLTSEPGRAVLKQYGFALPGS
jgi:molybdate transport system substrate-binding protein